MTRRLLLILLIACSACAYGFAIPTHTSTVDWSTGEVVITSQIAIGRKGDLLPGERLRAEREINQMLPLFVRDAVFDIAVDSFWTVESRALRDPTVMSSMEAIWETGRKTESFLNSNLTVLTVEYRFDLYPHVIAPFIEHASGFPPERRITYYPTQEFSGLVIYAKGSYPIHGRRGNETEDVIKPSLFPTLYDGDMNVLLDSECVDPEILTAHGMVTYTDNENWQDYEHIVGPYPLFTMAREVFGENRTDIILPDETVRRILALDHNIEMLCSGNVLIIVDFN